MSDCDARERSIGHRRRCGRAVWFTMPGVDRIDRTSVTGETEYALGATRTLYGIVAGSDGRLWFTGFNSNTVGRITVDGEVKEFPPGPGQQSALHRGRCLALRFTLSNADPVSRITPDGQVENSGSLMASSSGSTRAEKILQPFCAANRPSCLTKP